MANPLNTITVDGVTYAAEAYSASQAQKNQNDGSTLGKDAFLQLLVTQMRYQDPLDPQDNSESIAQLAQFSALEAMQNVASELTNLSTIVNNIDTSVLVGQLSGMIGKDIKWEETTHTADEAGNPISYVTKHEGVVKGVSISDGSPSVIAEADGKKYTVSISDVTSVTARD